MIKKILSCLGCFGVLVIIVIGLIVWQSFQFWLAQPGDEEIAFEVLEGQGMSSIADELAELDVIPSAFWFKVYAKLDGSARQLQAGEFTLPAGLNYAGLVDILIDAASDEVQITIPEGYTLAQIGEVVIENFDVSQEEWDLVTGPDSPLENHPFVLEADKPDGEHLEGYLFPDTYRFFAGATAEEIVGRMIDEMEENVDASFVDLDRLIGVSTMHEYITLASILEREVRGADDMKIVAGLFYNRLEIGMALQADSTVNYVTGKDTPGISLEDTRLDSPYNTYRNPGLPPGPISNPGFNALNATANPATTSYFFFLTDPEGTVFYANTHDEHVANKNQHLR